MKSLLIVLALTGAIPENPTEVYDAVAIDLKDNVAPADWYYTRYLSLWPYNDEASLASLGMDLAYQCNSLSWAPEGYKPVLTAGGTLWRIDRRKLGWSHEAWERLALEDVYFATTVKDAKGNIHRGWVDPTVEASVRKSTGSIKAVVRGDFFTARTSVDQLGKFKGAYSDFLNLPKTEKELIEILGAKETQVISKTAEFNKLFLLRGDGVQESEVALHNRVLELFPAVVGKRGSRFLYRSKDTDSNAGAASILENNTQGGNIKFAGKEHIYSLPNGLHGYFICDANNNRIAFVPSDTVAQDKRNPHDKVVYLGTFKCGQCHAQADGIIGFDPVISRLKVGQETAIGVISKEKPDEDKKRFLDAYYANEDLAKDAIDHRKTYKEAVQDIVGTTPQECIKNHLEWVHRYFYGKVDRLTAMAETGFTEEEFEKYINQTSPSPLVNLKKNGGTGWIPRELWESRYATLMQTKVWYWEMKP